MAMATDQLEAPAAEGDDWQRLQSEVRQYGPYTFFPDGLSVNPQSFGDPSGGIVALNREMERVGSQRNRLL